tara:strand:+ start:494 stop:985 length:492 start_codon:yes stop_codon:yes gene_type:complete
MTTKQEKKKPEESFEQKIQPKNFDEAMLEFQKLSIAAIKDSKNPYFKNTYASLEEVMDAARQANQFGLYFAQPLQMIALLDQVIQVVQTEITHAPTGEKRTSQCPVRVVDKKNPQAMGSGITYAKRYSLQAAFGLATDDDANEASSPNKKEIKHITPVKKEMF